LAATTHDILVIGGGITGAGIVRDATLRGLKAALVEKDDFAIGTSSRSSKLVHGGLRYLEHFELGLVFEACNERYKLLHLAPHLVEPMGFILPFYKESRRGFFMVSAGVWLYYFLALFRNVGRPRILLPSQVAQLEPALNRQHLVGAAHYYDCRTNDARLTLSTLKDAQKRGATIVNYAEVVGFAKSEGKITGVQLRDQLTGKTLTAPARLVLSAAGPWTDHILRLDDPASPHRLRPTKGVHLLFPRHRIPIQRAVYFMSQDGRGIFAIPWDKQTLFGTTDTDFQGDYDHIYADPADVNYLLDAANTIFPEAHVTSADVISAYAGVRPLIYSDVANASAVSREHQIFTTPSGLMVIAGGKLTTYRSMAEDLMNRALIPLRQQGVTVTQRCRTAEIPLDSDGTKAELAAYVARVMAGQDNQGFDPDVRRHLCHYYGQNDQVVMNYVKKNLDLGRRIVPELPYILAEVVYAVEHEMNLTLTDFLARRTAIILEAADQGLAAAPAVAALLGQHLGWDAAETQRQIAAYQTEVAANRAYRQG